MNSIKEKTRKIQNLSNTRTVKRINQISKSFSTAGPNQRGKMLQQLAGEINRTKDVAVKGWLVKFDSILRAKMEVAK